MSVVYQFRLTGVLYHQVRRSGKGIASVLSNWEDNDYELLCEYLGKCKKVVPKYISMLAELMGMSVKQVLKEIRECRSFFGHMGNDDEQEADCYEQYGFGEDSVDLTLFIQKYCNEIKQYM
jgi:hypothetical protein